MACARPLIWQARGVPQLDRRHGRLQRADHPRPRRRESGAVRTGARSVATVVRDAEGVVATVAAMVAERGRWRWRRRWQWWRREGVGGTIRR
eukprot:371339-Prymnesium_polylepis.1